MNHKRIISIINTILFTLFLVFLTSNVLTAEPKTVTFNSSDGLEITADLYIAHDLKNPFIILFHQAGWSRGAYLEIAPKLNEMGFNCMAVDQRSGGEINGVKNETYKRATAAKKATNYIDAYPDMEAALKYIKDNYAKGKIIIWGSSYSSALVIPLASEYTDLVSGVLSFSPGEYFARQGKSKTYITDAAKKLSCPVFITSAKNEKPNWENVFKAIPSKTKMSFLPETKGNHGSRALWERFSDSKDYWKAVKEFLNKNFLNHY